MQVDTPMKVTVRTKSYGELVFPIAQFAVSHSDNLLIQTPNGVSVFRSGDWSDLSGEALVGGIDDNQESGEETVSSS